MPAPSVYLDACIDVRLADSLRQHGYTVTTTRDQRMYAADDETQLQHATQNGWTLVSHNKRDFRRWHERWRQQGRAHSGIIILPKSPFPRLELRARMTLDWIAQRNLRMASQFVLWNDVQLWLNQQLVLTGYTPAEIREATGQAP